MEEKRAPINTAKRAQSNPGIFLLEAMALGSSNAIEAQESQGQKSFVNSDTLPTRMSKSGREILEAAGVKFLGPVEDDDLFQYVELPLGWAKVRTDHSMWSNLVANGQKRASIFYKAAFYDRDAFLRLDCRYGIEFDYDRLDKKGVAVAHVKDGDSVIYSTEPVSAKGKKSYEVSDDAVSKATKWLDEKHPEWKNPGAYWD